MLCARTVEAEVEIHPRKLDQALPPSPPTRRNSRYLIVKNAVWVASVGTNSRIGLNLLVSRTLQPSISPDELFEFCNSNGKLYGKPHAEYSFTTTQYLITLSNSSKLLLGTLQIADLF